MAAAGRLSTAEEKTASAMQAVVVLVAGRATCSMNLATSKGHPNFRDRITLQTYLKLALFQPKARLLMLEEVPVTMIIPALDDISSPEEQKEVFGSLAGPKRLYCADGGGHMSILTGNGAHEIMQVMLTFFADALAGHEI